MIYQFRLWAACTLLFMCYTAPLYSWNAMGHRIIAQIAVDNMNPSAIKRFTEYNEALNLNNQHLSLIDSSIWLDMCRKSYPKRFDLMHYIDTPFSDDGSKMPSMQERMNAVIALEQSREFLVNKKGSASERAIALRVLMHVVGDVHQPLHAATRVSKQYPHGDKGGNHFYLKKNTVAKNLHGYWDRAGGSLIIKPKKLSLVVIKGKARLLETQWPCQQVSTQFNPKLWVNESNMIAKTKVYALLDGHRASRAYRVMVEQTTDERMAYAGCRLAALLNEIDKTVSIEL